MTASEAARDCAEKCYGALNTWKGTEPNVAAFAAIIEAIILTQRTEAKMEELLSMVNAYTDQVHAGRYVRSRIKELRATSPSATSGGEGNK